MRRLVGRDVLGAPRAGGTRTLRAWGRSCRVHGDAPGDTGRRGRRPLPQMSPWPPCVRAAPAGGRDASAGRARRPRRAARRGRPCCTHGDVPGTRAAGDVGPYHKRPRGRHAPVPPRRGAGMHRLVGRDVLGAPRAGNARAARMGTSMRAWGRSGDAGRRGRRPLPCDIKPTAWLFQKFPCIRRTPYHGNVQRESHPLSDILVFYRMSPTFSMLSVCSVAAKPFCVFCAVVARHAGRRNHISLCLNLRMRSICVP